jgi:DNA-binding transcriptional LysR family regulator
MVISMRERRLYSSSRTQTRQVNNRYRIVKLYFMIETIQVGRLEGFFHVAKTGGYARASRAFPYPITQPGIHQQVRKLEAELGSRLFVREGRDHVALTAEGKALYAFVKPFFEGLPATVRAIRRRTFGGTLTVHAGGLLIRKLLPAWLRRLARERPDVTIDLHEAEVPAIPLLMGGATDIVVDFLPSVPDDVIAVRVGSTFGFVVVHATHAGAGRRGIRIADLKDTFISYPRGSVPFELQMKLLERRGVTPARTLSVGSADSILGFVEAGAGWSIIPWLDLAGPRSPHLAVERVGSPKGGFPIHVAFRRRDADDPLIAAVLRAAQSAAG